MARKPKNMPAAESKPADQQSEEIGTEAKETAGSEPETAAEEIGPDEDTSDSAVVETDAVKENRALETKAPTDDPVADADDGAQDVAEQEECSLERASCEDAGAAGAAAEAKQNGAAEEIARLEREVSEATRRLAELQPGGEPELKDPEALKGMDEKVHHRPGRMHFRDKDDRRNGQAVQEVHDLCVRLQDLLGAMTGLSGPMTTMQNSLPLAIKRLAEEVG